MWRVEGEGDEVDMSELSFGKFKGRDIESIPSGYLRWVVCESWFEEKYPYLVEEIDEELKYRDDWSKHF